MTNPKSPIFAAVPSLRAKHVLLAALLLAQGSVSAHTLAAEPDDAAKQQARELMTRGRQERLHADLQAALHSFSQADDIMHVPTTGFEVAQTLSALGMLVEATEAATRVASSAETPGEPEAFANARQAAKDLAHDLEERTPLLHLTYPESSEPTRLTLDGKALEPTAAFVGVRVNPGRHVAIAKRGAQTRKSVVDVAEKSAPEVSFAFSTEQPAPEAEASPVHHSHGPKPITIAEYSLSGVAFVGLATGLGLGVWSNHRKTEFERTCAPACSASSVSQLKNDYLVANIAAGVGAAAGLAAITLYLVGPATGAKEHRASASLSLTANAGADPGVTVSGTF